MLHNLLKSIRAALLGSLENINSIADDQFREFGTKGITGHKAQKSCMATNNRQATKYLSDSAS